MWTREMDRD
jgi:hypothetical protein